MRPPADIGAPREPVIDCRQLLHEDSTVFSRQSLEFPEGCGEGITPLFLLERYLRLIRTFTFGLIRAARSRDGIDFRLVGTGISLIGFSPPRMATDGGAVSLAISGGLLVARGHCETGMLSFVVEPAAERKNVQLILTGYCPVILGLRRPSRLRRLLYRFTQALIHRRLTERFLADLYRERCGAGSCLRVVRSGPPEAWI